METIGSRILFLMNLSNIQNKTKLSEIIDERSNQPAISKAVNDVEGFYLTKRIELKFAYYLGWNLHFLNCGFGQPIMVNNSIQTKISELQRQYPELYKNVNLNKYNLDKQSPPLKPLEEMTADELRGNLIKIIYLLKDPMDREIAVDLINSAFSRKRQ